MSKKDTDWATSAKGNQWRRYNGQNIVVGAKKNGRYWALHFDGISESGKFSDKDYASLGEAQNAAENMVGDVNE